MLGSKVPPRKETIQQTAREETTISQGRYMEARVSKTLGADRRESNLLISEYATDRQ